MQSLPELQLDDFDFADPEFWIAPIEVREAAFKALRDRAPISFTEEFEPPPGIPLPKGPGYWSLTKHRHILEASRQPDVFCSGKGATSVMDMPEQMLEFFGGMINMDEPRHTKQRKIISRGFTPRSLASALKTRWIAAPRTSSIASSRRANAISWPELAAPLPLEIICDMMGIPESQSQFVFERSNKILGLGDPDYMKEGEDPIMGAMGAGAELAGLMREMAAARRKSATPDLTSALINATEDEDVLTDAELASFFILLVVAGNETTRNAISHGMKALCENPDERARWAADFEGLAPTAVEEIVRWASPVIYMRRTLTRDYVMDDVTLREGDKVALWYASGNRDEDVFDDPFRFDIARSPNEHVGFGGPGPHYCMGANLARREITAMFRQIFKRLPDLEITGEPDRLASNFVHGIKRMRCRFTPGRVAA